MPEAKQWIFPKIQYMGSFPVSGPDQNSRAEVMRKHMEQLRMRLDVSTVSHDKNCVRPKSVLLVVSLAGIKVCSPDGRDVYMAHALRRISYATCDPCHSQFSFLAREPKGHFTLQYCHTFLAKTPEQAEELNSIVGNAFRMAYAAQLQPNFQQVIQLQDTEPQPIVWPKQIPSSKVSSGGVVGGGGIGVGVMNVIGKSGPQAPPPGSIPGLRGYGGGGTGGGGSTLSTPSSEESNSPTELNSAKRLGDKPPLVKRLALGNTPTDENGPSQGHMTLHHQSAPISEKSQLIVRDTTSNHKLIDIENNRLTESPPSSEGKRRTGSSTLPPPAPPERTDSLNNKPEEELKTAPWFQAGIPREITLEVLGHEPVGSFMVRESTTKPGCYALSLRVPQEFQPLGIAHYLIIRTNKGYKIKGFTKEFTTLTALITHHSVMPELLPCPLSLNRYNPSFAKSDSNKDFADIDSDPDYNTLADFRKMMADLNV